MRRMESNNPGMALPAGEVLSRAQFARMRSQTSRNVVELSDPSGGQEEVIEKVQSSVDEPLTKYDVGWRRVVRNFSPSWFSVTMGTGVVSLLLIAIPFKADWLYWLSVIFFGLNAILFSLAFIVSVLRYTLYPEIWGVMIADSTNSLFLATIPISFATLVESWILLCCPYWGYWSVSFAWICWMIDSIVAAAITVSLPFLLISQTHQHSLERITAAQLLPIAATIVAAGCGKLYHPSSSPLSVVDH